MPTARRSFQCVVLEGRLYAIGGVLFGEQLDSVESYSPIDVSWIVLRATALLTSIRSHRVMHAAM